MVTIRRPLSRFGKTLVRALPEGALKNCVRCACYALIGGAPRELMVNKGECAVQVGTPNPACIAKLEECVGETGRIVIIEPEAKNLKRLRAHVEANRLANVTIIPKGAWNAKGQHRFMVSDRDSDHRLEHNPIHHYNDLDGYVSSQVIEVDTVDNMMRQAGIPAIDFIAISVNGMELQVLQGMETILAHTKRLQVIGRGRSQDTGTATNQLVLSFLMKRGFKGKIGRNRPSGYAEWGPMDGDVYAWKQK